jgi:hypothetical protein
MCFQAFKLNLDNPASKKSIHVGRICENLFWSVGECFFVLIWLLEVIVVCQVKEPCMSSNGFLQLNSCFAPRLSTSTLHEPATAASNHPRAPARTESLRLSWPRMLCQPSRQPRPAASKHTISRCNCRPQPPTATLQIIRSSSTIYKTHRLPRGAASFKSLYLKRPPEHLDSTTSRERGASDTALRLPVTYLDRTWSSSWTLKHSNLSAALCPS